MSGSDKTILDAAENIVEAKGMRMLGTLEKPFSQEMILKLLSQLTDTQTKHTFSPKPITLIPIEELREIINDNRVVVHYQPKINIGQNSICSAEALARVVDKNGQILYPDSFIDALNECDFGNEFTLKVLEQSLKAMNKWKSQGINVDLALNVTSDDLNDSTFADDVLMLAAEHKIPTHQLEIEVTEYKILSNLGGALATLARLRMKGVAVAIDDFGIGSSTLQQIKQLPCTTLKIDKLFVTNAFKNARSRSILNSCVALGKSLNLELVAEGVETEDDLSLISLLNIDMAQGWYFSKAIDADKFADYYQHYSNHGDMAKYAVNKQ